MVSRRGLIGGAAGVAALGTLGAIAAVQALGSADPSPQPSTGGIPRVQGWAGAEVPLVGGEVTLTGTSLDAVAEVLLDGVPVPIVSASPTELVLRVPNQLDYVAADARLAVLAEGAAAPTELAAPLQYRVLTDVDRQMRYAFRYWKDYNEAKWSNFNSVGGDCTNFANQTLIARGWEMNDKWRSGGTLATATPTWYYSPAIDEYLTKRHPVIRSREEWHRVEIGDLVLFDWEPNGTPNHTMIVSQVYTREDGSTGIRCVGHNLDIRYRDLDDDVLPEYPDYTAWFFSLGTRL